MLTLAAATRKGYEGEDAIFCDWRRSGVQGFVIVDKKYYRYF
jgi:hypothetical protein